MCCCVCRVKKKDLNKELINRNILGISKLAEFNRVNHVIESVQTSSICPGSADHQNPESICLRQPQTVTACPVTPLTASYSLAS